MLCADENFFPWIDICAIQINKIIIIIIINLNQDRNTAPLALIYAVIMFKRFHELSRVQRLPTVLLYSGNASKEVRNFLTVKKCT